MSGIIVLILRTLLVLSLYAFIGWMIYTIWQDLHINLAWISHKRIPTLQLRMAEVDAVQFNNTEVVLGRDTNCEFQLEDDTVSGRHARLSHHHNQWWVEDLHSTNGTFINDERVETATVVTSGDELRCGQVVLEIIITPK